MDGKILIGAITGMKSDKMVEEFAEKKGIFVLHPNVILWKLLMIKILIVKNGKLNFNFFFKKWCFFLIKKNTNFNLCFFLEIF